MASHLLEQQEKLRRVVDEWRVQSHHLLSDLLGAVALGSSPASASSCDPVRLHVEPIEHANLSALLESDNVAVSKFVTVLSYDCVEISRLYQSSSKNLFRQLLLFGHHSSPQEALLEGEPQKVFGRSLSLFMELYETTSRMTDVLGNLVQQLSSVYSLHDKNVRPLNSVKNFMLRTAFESLGSGLAMFLVLDEILKQNSHIKGHLSLFARMFNKVKLEVDIFDITVEDLDFLGQVVSHLGKLLEVGFFQRLLQRESPWHATLEQVRCNKKFIDACTSCVHEGLSEILSRLDTWKESPLDRRKILHHMALFLFSTYASVEAPEKKMGKLLLEMLQLVPLIYIEGGKRLLLLDILKSQCPPSLSSWPPMREAVRNCDAVMSNHLMRLDELHLRLVREKWEKVFFSTSYNCFLKQITGVLTTWEVLMDWHAIRGVLSSWVVSFQSTLHPSSQVLSEAWVQLHLKQMMQGLLFANRLHVLVLSVLDLHEMLEVPIKKEKLRSLCHMVVSLKVLGNMFLTKGASIIQSLPHIINVIQADIENYILPSKAKLESEVVKGSQMSKLSFLSSLTRGGKETDTRLTDSLSLVLMSLQLLQGGGSHKRQLIFSIILDVLQSIGHLDIDFSNIRKLTSKLGTVVRFQSIIEEVSDCCFLYWKKEMIGSFLSMAYTDVSRFAWLQYLLNAFSDGLWLLKLGHAGKLTLQSYEEEIEKALKNEIVAPLCRDIETDLRLHVHSTQMKGSVFVNPTKTGVRNLSWYLPMKPLRLPFKTIDIRLFVESYLNSAFYNHSAMSTSDWKIYSEMRQLAELKYGLALDYTHLAEHSIDHDFDINHIVQDLHTFADNFAYSIYKQIFIEKGTSGQVRKNLRVISVEHVASSVAIHGLQPISTALDAVLTFLTQMFATLSELLHDKYVRSGLFKESNFWKSDKRTVTKQSSLQQGELKIDLGKLPLGDHGLSVLEQLHAVITKMGNALGLIRILLAGGSRHACNMSGFVSRPRCDMTYLEFCQRLGFVGEVVAAGKIMDTAIDNNCQSQNIPNSFAFHVNMFIKELQCSKYHHPRDFFLIIPSLITNMVESKVHYKDKLLRKDHDLGKNVNLYDGFIMGLAFLLKMMEQEKSFDELNWFASVKKNLNDGAFLEDSKHVEERKVTGLAGLKFWSQAPSISTESQKIIDKHKRYQEEIELVECGLKVARTIMS